jgi:Cytochrome P450
MTSIMASSSRLGPISTQINGTSPLYELTSRAIHRDPELYPDPETFNPNRWIDPKFPTYKEPLTRYPNLTNYSIFGFGRRICPGMNIAERSLHLLTARIIWAFQLSHKLDAQGREIPIPLYNYTAGFNTQPEQFLFELAARSERKADIIKQAYSDSRNADPLRKQSV